MKILVAFRKNLHPEYSKRKTKATKKCTEKKNESLHNLQGHTFRVY